jgi:hypothetical protein
MCELRRRVGHSEGWTKHKFKVMKYMDCDLVGTLDPGEIKSGSMLVLMT